MLPGGRPSSRSRTLTHLTDGLPRSAHSDAWSAPSGRYAAGTGRSLQPGLLQMPSDSRIRPPSFPERAGVRPARGTRVEVTRQESPSDGYGSETRQVRNGPRGRLIRTLPILTEGSGVPGRRNAPSLPVDRLQVRDLLAQFPVRTGTAWGHGEVGHDWMPVSSQPGREPQNLIDRIRVGLPWRAPGPVRRCNAGDRTRPGAGRGIRRVPDVGGVGGRRLTAGQATR